MACVLQNLTKQRKRKIVFDELKAEQISSDDPRDDPTRSHSNMNSERPIANRNVLIQCTLIAVLTALLNFVKAAFLRVVKCGKADLQHELDLFNELHEHNDACEWDKEGLFLAFIKGEDIRDRREKKRTLKAKKITKARIICGNALTSTAKRPIIEELFPRGLYILPRPCTPFRVRSGVTTTTKNTVHTCDHKPNDCSVVDASVSDACLSVTKDIVNGCKEHTTTAPISGAYQVTHQPVVSLVTSP